MARETPFEDLERLVDELQSRFERSYRRLDDDELDWRRSAGESTLDLAEYDDEYAATVDLPGFEKDDVDVRLDGRQLTVTADRDDETATEADSGRYLQRERREVASVQRVTLPGAVRVEDATATMARGVLTVTVPKQDAADGTSVDVE